LKACEAGLGDYVAVPGYTHVGSVVPIVLAGARPIFVDVNQYGNMSPEDLAAVVSVMKVKAVISRASLLLNRFLCVNFSLSCEHSDGSSYMPR